MSYYNGRVARALISLFPHIAFDKSLFSVSNKIDEDPRTSNTLLSLSFSFSFSFSF